MSRIGNQYNVVIPVTVLEELDKLKLKAEIDKKSLNKVAKNINIAFTKHFLCMEDVDVSLLPNGFDKRNSDCMILSVALKYTKQANMNPILLISDTFYLHVQKFR